MTEGGSWTLTIKRDPQNDKSVIVIIEFHPSESIPDSYAMMNLLRQGNQLRKEQFVRGVYDIYEGDRYVGRYYNLDENKKLNYIYKYFPDEKQQRFLMEQEIRIRFFEDLWFPALYDDKTLKITKALKKD